MRTRTLLLLAIGCGLAILLAGGIQLLRLDQQEDTVTELAEGETGKAGDVSVELLSSSTDDDVLIATVRIGGADDPKGLAGFALVAPGKVVNISSSTCAGITVAQHDCALTFATADLQGTVRQLTFSRADEKLRWVLARGE